MERFCKGLRNQAIKIIYYEKKEMIWLTDEETRFYETLKVCCISKNKKLVLMKMIKNTIKSEIITIT